MAAAEVYREAAFSDGKEVAGLFSGGANFFRLKGDPPFGESVRLWLRSWRKSVFEK